MKYINATTILPDTLVEESPKISKQSNPATLRRLLIWWNNSVYVVLPFLSTQPLLPG